MGTWMHGWLEEWMGGQMEEGWRERWMKGMMREELTGWSAG